MQKNFIPLNAKDFHYNIFALKCKIVAKIMITSTFALKPKTKLKLLPRSELFAQKDL